MAAVKKAKASQKELVRRHIKQISAHLVMETEEGDGSLHGLLGSLVRVVDQAQNGPPDGEGDGSLDENLWPLAKEVVVALRNLEWAVDRWEIAAR